jgi:hypothetical protein
MAAALLKMRMPRTTTTPVDSCPPTPSWSPRKTTRAATSTLLTNETTKTLSSKIPSSCARTAPKTASSAATTAIGR